MTPRDKVRRLVIALVVVACVGGLALAVSNTREIDSLGEEVPEEQDVDGVVLSGDEEALATIPPPPEEQAPLRTIVERRFPAPNSEQLSQVQVGIDLGARYTGTLVVGGVEVPESQLIRQPELNQVFFSPGRGRVVEEWAPGRNCVTAIIWEVTGTRADDPRTVDWCFEVT